MANPMTFFVSLTILLTSACSWAAPAPQALSTESVRPVYCRLVHKDLKQQAQDFIHPTTSPAESVDRAIWVANYIRAHHEQIKTLNLPWLADDVLKAIRLAQQTTRNRSLTPVGRAVADSYYKKLQQELKQAIHSKSLTITKVIEFFDKANRPRSFLYRALNPLEIKVKYSEKTHFDVLQNFLDSYSPYLLPWLTSEPLTVPELNKLWSEGIFPLWYPMQTVTIDFQLMTSVETADHDLAHAGALTVDIFTLADKDLQQSQNHTERMILRLAALRELHLKVSELNGELREATEVAFYFLFHEETDQLSLLVRNPRELAADLSKKRGESKVIPYLVARLSDPEDQQSALPVDLQQASTQEIESFVEQGRLELARLIMENLK